LRMIIRTGEKPLRKKNDWAALFASQWSTAI
jgi:hypothetical protein